MEIKTVNRKIGKQAKRQTGLRAVICFNLLTFESFNLFFNTYDPGN